MVSNVLDLTDAELQNALLKLRGEFSGEKEYKAWRKIFPQEWEM